MLAEPMRSIGPMPARAIAPVPPQSPVKQPQPDVRLLCSTVGAGLGNLGNTCYMNAILQCVTHLPPFAQFCEHEGHRRECRARQPCVACLLEAHVRQALRQRALAGGGDAVVYPCQLHQLLPRLSPEFVVGRQEDAHEFYVMLLDAAERQSMERQEKLVPGVPRSHIAALFEGSMCSEVRCLRCQHSSASHQPFTAVPLDICGRSSLPDALRAFRTTERLSGSNQYRCDKCRALTDAVKTLRLDRAGPVLAFHLKRFDGLFGGKLRHHVHFPQRLTEAALLGEPEPGRAEGGGGVHFTCVGVVVHQGCSARGGHYYAYVKTRSTDEQGLPVWHLMDDSVTQRVSWKRVVADEAYIIFYMRVDRQDALLSAWPPGALHAGPAGAERPPALPDGGLRATEAVAGDAAVHARRRAAASSDELASPTPMPAGRPPAELHVKTGLMLAAATTLTRGIGHGSAASAARRPQPAGPRLPVHRQPDVGPRAGGGDAASDTDRRGPGAQSRSCQRDDARACAACKASLPCVGRRCGGAHEASTETARSAGGGAQASRAICAAAPVAAAPSGSGRINGAKVSEEGVVPKAGAAAKRALPAVMGRAPRDGPAPKRSCLKQSAAGGAPSAAASVSAAHLDATAEAWRRACGYGENNGPSTHALREIGANLKARFLQSPVIQEAIRARLERVRDHNLAAGGMHVWHSFGGKDALLEEFRRDLLVVDAPVGKEAMEFAIPCLRKLCERMEADARARRKQGSKRGTSKS